MKDKEIKNKMVSKTEDSEGTACPYVKMNKDEYENDYLKKIS